MNGIKRRGVSVSTLRRWHTSAAWPSVDVLNSAAMARVCSLGSFWPCPLLGISVICNYLRSLLPQGRRVKRSLRTLLKSRTGLIQQSWRSLNPLHIASTVPTITSTSSTFPMIFSNAVRTFLCPLANRSRAAACRQVLDRSERPYSSTIADGLRQFTKSCLISSSREWRQMEQLRRWRPRFTRLSNLLLGMKVFLLLRDETG